jgi:hypothetical protein
MYNGGLCRDFLWFQFSKLSTEVLLHRSQGYRHCPYTIHMPKLSSLQIQGEHYRCVEENICWQGEIAKGETHVFHGRCIAVGKSIESKFPQEVNCSTRIDLDILTKHFLF